MELSLKQKVICVGLFKAPRKNKEEYPVYGRIYTIREFVEHKGMIGILLEEIVNPIYQYKEGPGETAFGIRNFRPMEHPLAVNAQILLRFPITEEKLDVNYIQKTNK